MDDVLLEDRLRQALRDGETDLQPAPDLAARTVAAGRRTVRRRQGYVAAGLAAASLSAVAAWGVATDPTDDARPSPAPPAPSETVAPGAWVRSLPRGEAPRRAYLVGTVLHRPDGSEVRLRGYDDAGMVGDTVAGTVVLGERTERGAFSSEYVLVAPDGSSSVIADGTFTGAQEAVVSPDGRYLARDRTVVDMLDQSVVAEIPDRAEVLVDWTDDGIRYWTGSRQMLWRPGERPEPAPADPAVPGQLTTSPEGRWTVTAQLGVVDRDTGERRWLAVAPASPVVPAYPPGSVWEDDDHVLLTVASYVVRCDVDALSCQRATKLLPIAANESAQLSPTRLD